jgi:hypothetical protein
MSSREPKSKLGDKEPALEKLWIGHLGGSYHHKCDTKLKF